MARGNEGQLVRISQSELKRLQKIDHEIGVLRMVNNELKLVIKNISDAELDLSEAVEKYRLIMKKQNEKIVELFNQQRVEKAHQEPESPPPAKRS